MTHLRVDTLQRLLRTLSLSVLLVIAPLARADHLTGKLVIVGSDTLAELMTLWSAGFSALHPGVSVELQAGGSAAAPTALVRGTANVGSMSRRMTAAEKQRFVDARGFEPLEIALALDTIVLIVNKENPLSIIDLSTISRIFGDAACDVRDPALFWHDVIDQRSWRDVRIEAYGRTAASGTYEFFRRRALCGGDPSARIGEAQSNAAIVDTVAAIRSAIGYVGMGFVDERVKVPSLRLPSGTVVPFKAMSESTNYPLKRTLYLYLPLSDSRELPRLECEFLRYIRSDEGTDLLSTVGFLPLRDSDSSDAAACRT